MTLAPERPFEDSGMGSSTLAFTLVPSFSNILTGRHECKVLDSSFSFEAKKLLEGDRQLRGFEF